MNHDFKSTVQAYWSAFANGMLPVLATADGDFVTARTVNVAHHDWKVYFFTFGSSLKCTQMRKNPHVALCHEGTVLRGTATILGPCTAPESADGAAALQAVFPKEVAYYCSLPGVVIVEITPSYGSFGTSETDMLAIDFAAQTVAPMEM